MTNVHAFLFLHPQKSIFHIRVPVIAFLTSSFSSLARRDNYSEHSISKAPSCFQLFGRVLLPLNTVRIWLSIIIITDVRVCVCGG